MHSNRPLFSPEPSSAGEYVMVVLALLNNFHKTLRERQAQCLNKVCWGQPVIPGVHGSFTIDRKHRGNPNPFDMDPNAAESDDEAEIEGPQQTEAATCGNTDPDVVIHPELLENEQREKSMPACELNVHPVHTEEPLKPVPSPSESVLHSNQEDNQKWKTKRQKLCQKLSNKENHKQKVKLCCLQRRSLFRKSQPEVSPALPSSHETQDLKTKQMQASLSNILPNGITTTSLDMAESLEENLFPCDPLSIATVGPVSKDTPLSNKSSPPRTPNCENEKASPLRESNPSNPCEIRSSSPVFSAYDSPFRNSGFVSHLKDNSMAKAEESAGSVGSVTKAEETSSDHHSKPHPRLLESESQDSVDEQQKKNKKHKKQRPMVQCPLCCDWFTLKVIETHAANCGIITPMQLDAQLNIVDLASVPNENEVERETCDLNPPSESEDSKPDPTKNMKSMLEAETAETAAAVQDMECPVLFGNNSKESTHQHSTSLHFVLEAVEKSGIAFENGKTGQQTKSLFVPPEIQAEASDLVPILKRCFICDLSYVEGKPFSTHLRTCRKKYQKLKRQFSGLNEENEEPQRKTRSRSFLATNTNNSNSEKKFNSNT